MQYTKQGIEYEYVCMYTLLGGQNTLYQMLVPMI